MADEQQKVTWRDKFARVLGSTASYLAAHPEIKDAAMQLAVAAVTKKVGK